MKALIFSISVLFTSHFATSQTLDTFLKEAMQNNPKIQQFEWEYKINLEKENEVNSLPNTEIGVGFFASEPETRTGAQTAKITMKQKIPWFGAIATRKNYARSLSEVKYEEITIIKRKLVVSVSQSYYRLQAIQTKQILLKRHINLLKTYETLAESATETGKNSVVDVLKIQLQRNNLEAKKEILSHAFLSEQVLLNSLLNREKSASIILDEKHTLEVDLVIVSSENLKLHPELIHYDKLYNTIEKSELLNQKEKKPVLGFGVDYIAVTERPDFSFSDNGKDIFMPMVSLSIPIFNKKYHSKTKQNNLQQSKITTQKKERFNVLQTLLENAIYKRTAAKINYETQEKNDIKIEQATTILLKKYETASIRFEELLDLQELQLNLKMKQIEAIKEYDIQTSVIYGLVGE